eukprot:CAMPEP_0172443832 /NCGR_PEP_ID=MMETSP1065-20121228/4024_1 /TAXON_ID=265537 /ORGANISM="Amphiprora paludosa, Strain CCMP125" /LENGTH=437 /DNA_ID=CAMNT_0013194179 /DNA_START=389 /DNA_END=1702 /DNA_ORIENTATION=-
MNPSSLGQIVGTCLLFTSSLAWTPNWNQQARTPFPKRSTNSKAEPELTVLTLAPLVAEPPEQTTTTSTTVVNGDAPKPNTRILTRNDPGGKGDKWDHYSITGGDPYFLFSEEYYQRRSGIDTETVVEYLIPIVAPVIAFLSYDLVAGSFSSLLTVVANNNWVAVDGGSFQAKIITPTINGVVLPAISVLFATLTSTTIRTLRDRQLDIRASINEEAGELRAMEYLLAAYPDAAMQALCRQYLLQYTSRIIAESQPDWRHPMQAEKLPSTQGGMDSELNGVLKSLTGAEMQVLLQDQSFQSVTRLRQARQRRLTALQSTYPPLHYGILAVLASGTCTGFLMEADQELLFFMNAVQLKVLWSMLVGTFVACFAVFYDLLNPFTGCYQVTAAVDQLYTVRQGLKASTQLSLLDYGKAEECKIAEENGSNDDDDDECSDEE